MAHDLRDQSHGASVSSPVQSVEHTLGSPLGEQGRELSALEAATAFFAEFDRVLQRIRQNEHVMQSAQLSHGADGVLRAAGQSPNIASEALGESLGRGRS